MVMESSFSGCGAIVPIRAFDPGTIFSVHEFTYRTLR
jgi:hypothetical protein